MHHRLVADVAVGKHHLIDVELGDQAVQVALGVDRNAGRVERAGQLRRIEPPLDVGYLGGGESHHLKAGVIAEDDVEVVEIAPRRAHDEHALHRRLVRH